ncbi:MAG: DUF2780 domain-containing protein [Gammaproteobacteria bacterium]|nr:DUF2780 domain-containing protein [Gammaproteobacteria bacterium]
MKNKIVTISFISTLLFILSACSSIPKIGNDSTGAATLTNQLTSQLGVSNVQALGGTAALIGLAKQTLSAVDFSSVTKALPGLGSLSEKIPASSAGKIGAESGLKSVAGQFTQLGMDSDMVGKFVPVVLDYAKSAGGDNVMSLLKGAFK